MSATDNEQTDAIPSTPAGLAASRIRRSSQSVIEAFFNANPEDVNYAVRQLGTLINIEPSELEAAQADGDASTIVARAEASAAAINALLVVMQLAAERAANLTREVSDIASDIEREDELY